MAVEAEFNILLTSAGRRVSLLRRFKKALADLSVPGKIIATDVQRTAAAMHVADGHELVPSITSEGYIDALGALCVRHRLRLIVPLIDTELPVLAPHRATFAREGVELLVSSTEVNELCLDKQRTCKFFERIGVDTPRILDVPTLLGDANAGYPFFLKPADGSCSGGATRIDTREQLAFYSQHTRNAIVQEFIKGNEYTLDILTDFDGRTRCVVPRLRMETRAGETSKGITVKDPVLIEAGRHVVDALPGARGCITVQCFYTSGSRPIFIEINPRFGGGFPLAAAAGADYPRWIIQWLIGQDPVIGLDGWTDGTVMLRYDEALFLRAEDIA
ncbi:MAG TPA: ATP-grasp domain-containing protein [Xanthobacteraceae bacterium]|jgi:carbamoyl-phosphate synthase large subunit